MSFNKKIIHALIVISFLFLSLIGYLTYFQFFRADKLAYDGRNPRTVANENKVKRGDIVSSDGVKLAYSEMSADSQTRVYPYNNVYAHIIGYNSVQYGRSGLEYTYNGYIMGSSFSNELFNIKRTIDGEDKEGANLTLTIDHKLQQKAYDLLGSHRGAVIALDPSTGAVLALVSKPDFNPNSESLSANWESLNSGEESVFLPRATCGLYAPGSVFKTITAVSAAENGMDSVEIEDTGSKVVAGYEFKNYDGHEYGLLDLKKGFAKSSNVYFAELAYELGYRKMHTTAEGFMIGKDIAFDLDIKTGQTLQNRDKTNVAAVGMGQGDTLVTPMNMALVAQALANGGVMMSPYLVESADLSNGYNVYKHSRQVLSEATDADTAEKIKECMIECVKSGTGVSAQISGVEVAGKTGTAENTGEDHAWFIAYAPADDPKIALCVMVENADNTGGVVCGPIVRSLIYAWLNK
ncbi:MAG: peptidoglycan glycosyltransferase [Clostridia bacterium]|nr:peptidoglycan glycosyltransferase [Clostridia bacterium]